MPLQLFLPTLKRLKPAIRQVNGVSMLPRFRPGWVVVAWPSARLRPGDVVIIVHGGLEKIKRIQQLDERGVYVLGDNLARSTDSRSFGWLPLTAIKAKVFWPK